MSFADAVRPVGTDADLSHVGDDQQGRIFKGQSVLSKLIECGVQVLALPLVLPSEVVAFPDIGPSLAATVFASSLLEGIRLACWVDIRGFGFVQQFAKVEELLLGC